MSSVGASGSGSSARSLIPKQHKYDRIVLLVDMDCFYCQVEEKLDPTLKGQPLAVVQYNAWRGGGIIAVNYAARAKGVTRYMRGDEALEQCPEIQLVKVPSVREKADLSKYRDAGKQVANVLQRYTPLLERASVDEAYLDITESVNKRLASMNAGSFVLKPEQLVNTFAVGYKNIGDYITKITTRFSNPNVDEFVGICSLEDEPAVRQSDIRLLLGAAIAGEIRAAVKLETTYECSAGIAHNKILAKLACGMNKPNKQTILPLAEIQNLFETLPVGKITGLGGKFGEEVCERCNVRFWGQLLKFTEAELQKKFDEKNGTWLYNMCRGIHLEAVTPRFYSKSIGCCKKFPGRNNITGLNTLRHWLDELSHEICERLEKDIIENNRKAKQMVVSFIQEINGEEISSSRSAPLNNYDQEILAKNSLEVVKANTKIFFRAGSETVLNNPIRFLGISVGKFETITNAQNKLQEMFANQAARKRNTEVHSSANNEATNNVAKKTPEVQKKPKNFFANFVQNKSMEKSNDITTSECINNNADETLVEHEQFTARKEKENKSEEKSFFLKALRKQKERNEAQQATEEACDFKQNNVREKQQQPSSEDEVMKLENELQMIENEVKSVSSKESIKSSFATNLASSELMATTENPKAAEEKSFFLQVLRKQKEANEALTLQAEQTCNFQDDDIREKQQQSNNDDLKKLENPTEIETKKEPVKSFFANILGKSKTTAVFSTDVQKKRKFTETNDIDENTPLQQQEQTNITQSLQQFDYQTSYAEFALPEICSDLLKFTKCDKCGAKLLADDERALQSHQDLHYAQELSQQQRLEYRSEIKTKFNANKSSPNNANKKLKKANASDTTTSSIPAKGKCNITKFLKPVNANSTMSCELPVSSTTNMHICKECNLPVNPADIDEHKDFHIAKDLQRKLNQLEVRTVSVNKKHNTTSKTHDTSLKPISQYFSQSNC